MTETSQSIPMKRVLRYELLLLLVSIIWGFAFAAQQIGMQKGLGPMTFSALRFGLGALCLIPVILWRRNSQASGGGRTSFPSSGA